MNPWRRNPWGRESLETEPLVTELMVHFLFRTQVDECYFFKALLGSYLGTELRINSGLVTYKPAERQKLPNAMKIRSDEARFGNL